MREYHNFSEGFKSADMLGDCRKSQIMANLAISHVIKSITYKHQIHRFRVFRQSLELSVKSEGLRYLVFIVGIGTSSFFHRIYDIHTF